MIFDTCLTSGEAGDDGGEGVHVGLEDDIVGNAPALPARMEIFNQLVHRADQHIGALEDLFGIQLSPTARQFLGRLAAMIRHDDALHQRVQFEPCVSIAGNVSHQLHSPIDLRHSPS
jgi:hypothetical protein